MPPTCRAASSPPSDRGVEPLSEPAVDRTEQFARLLHLALVAPETREARSRAELPKLCLLLPGDLLKAQAYFERALAIARQQQAKSWELRAAMSLARLWRDQSKVQQARELLAPVYGWFTEGFDTRDLKEAKALLEQLAA